MDAGLDHLGQGLQTLNSLQRLSLVFSAPLLSGQVRITDDGLNYFSQGLQKLTSLHFLSLHFQRFAIEIQIF